MKLLIPILLLLITISIVQVLNLPLLEETRIYTANGEIGTNPGVAINNTSYEFGIITPGSIASKDVTILNNYEFPINVKVYSSGNISKALLIKDNNFWLEPNEKKDVRIGFYASDHPLGKYTGTIIIALYS